MKNILKEVISKLNSEKDGYCRIKHKRCFLEYLEDGDLVFKPRELHDLLWSVIDSDGMRPRGEKLFSFHRKCKFTLTENKEPYRPEEALERFIIVSNPGEFFNQVPTGGGKESIDIGIEESDSKFTFVELKPWSSTNSPLYAIVESLKNLIEYRIIRDRKIKDIPEYDVCLMILAPESYYKAYGLIDSVEKPLKDKVKILEKSLNEISSEFNTKISFMMLPIEKEYFLNKCKEIYDNREAKGQQPVSLYKSDSIPELVRSNWRLLATSD